MTGCVFADSSSTVIGVEVSIDRFPFGEMEGAPALALQAGSVGDADLLTAVVESNIRPGVSILWIREAPWGEPLWDQSLHRMLSHPKLSHVTVAAVRSIAADRWSNIRIHWVGDVSSLLASKTTSANVVEAIGQLHYFPPLRELIAIRPDLANVRPALLDELQQGLDYEGAGYVYAPPGDTPYMETALHALTRCVSPWALRFDREKRDER